MSIEHGCMDFSGGSSEGHFSGMMALHTDQSGLWSVWEKKKCNSECKQLFLKFDYEEQEGYCSG